MISGYETPAVAIAGEHELSAEELAKFAREELPRLVEEVLGELEERFELGLGLSLAPLGVVFQKTCHAGARAGSVSFSVQGLVLLCQTGSRLRAGLSDEDAIWA